MKKRITIFHVRKKLWLRPTIVDETPIPSLLKEPVYEYAAVTYSPHGGIDIAKSFTRQNLHGYRYVFVRQTVASDRVWYCFYDVQPPFGAMYNYFVRVRDRNIRNENHFWFQTCDRSGREMADYMHLTLECGRPRGFYI